MEILAAVAVVAFLFGAWVGSAWTGHQYTKYLTDVEFMCSEPDCNFHAAAPGYKIVETIANEHMRIAHGPDRTA